MNDRVAALASSLVWELGCAVAVEPRILNLK